MRIRIYYDKTSAAPLIWSFDHGAQDTEAAISGWVLHEVNAVGALDMRVASSDREHPRVWIEIPGAQWTELQGTVLHVYGSLRK